MRELFIAATVYGLLLGASAGSAPVLAAQGSVLPEATGRDVTMKVCGDCHSAETVASVRHTRDEWHEVIDRMVAAGAKGSAQELAVVLDYLAVQFPAEEQQTLNLNAATAIELESVAGLLRKEAAALIAYREKNGPCKSLEDLKKVAGLDYKKIDSRKDRLACRPVHP